MLSQASEIKRIGCGQPREVREPCFDPLCSCSGMIQVASVNLSRGRWREFTPIILRSGKPAVVSSCPPKDRPESAEVEDRFMDWITPEIAIGNRIDAHDPGLRAKHGFQAVISLDGSMTDGEALALGYEDSISLPFVDGPGNTPTAYRRVVQDLIDMVKDSPPVLVHCHAGRSRSVTVVAGYLVKIRGCTVRAAYDFIATKRDIAVQDGLPDLVHGLRRYCLEDRNGHFVDVGVKLPQG